MQYKTRCIPHPPAPVRLFSGQMCLWPSDLSSVLRTHIKNERTDSCRLSSDRSYVHLGMCTHRKKNLIKYVHSKGVYISIFFLISEMSYSACSVNSKLIISAIWKLPGLYNRKEHICHKDKTCSALRSWSKSFSECWPDPREQGERFICSVWLRLFQVTLYYKDAQCVREKPAVISAIVQ